MPDDIKNETINDNLEDDIIKDKDIKESDKDIDKAITENIEKEKIEIDKIKKSEKLKKDNSTEKFKQREREIGKKDVFTDDNSFRIALQKYRDMSEESVKGFSLENLAEIIEKAKGFNKIDVKAKETSKEKNKVEKELKEVKEELNETYDRIDFHRKLVLDSTMERKAIQEAIKLKMPYPEDVWDKIKDKWSLKDENYLKKVDFRNLLTSENFSELETEIKFKMKKVNGDEITSMKELVEEVAKSRPNWIGAKNSGVGIGSNNIFGKDMPKNFNEASSNLRGKIKEK